MGHLRDRRRRRALSGVLPAGRVDRVGVDCVGATVTLMRVPPLVGGKGRVAQRAAMRLAQAGSLARWASAVVFLPL